MPGLGRMGRPLPAPPTAAVREEAGVEPGGGPGRASYLDLPCLPCALGWGHEHTESGHTVRAADTHHNWMTLHHNRDSITGAGSHTPTRTKHDVDTATTFPRQRGNQRLPSADVLL